ncbi:MAG: tyramine oxidase subunit B [Thermomicrobiales bacterium]|nr:tyramine oxidase subunit B [Thermomicrobiales bacterium]
MSSTHHDFIYLNEPDMIAAGVTDMARCVDVMEEALILLQKGDFRMPGANGMSHGAMFGFPKEPEFPGMPADGPDRRFMAMPAYLGGRFGTTGVKWYGSNLENRTRGLPRSIHLFVLNDADTCVPLAVMSGNLISAYRTGAIPGVAVKHLARKDARVLGIVGPGVIGRVTTEATLSQRPDIDRIVVKGVDEADVQRYADYMKPHFPHITIEGVASEEEVAREADIIIVTVTTDPAGSIGYPYFKREWIKPGALMLLPAAVRFDDAFVADPATRLVVDAWKLYEAWAEEYGDQCYEKIGIVGNRWHALTAQGAMPAGKIEEIANIALGATPARTSDEEIILYSAGGMPIEDVAWATEIYRNAIEKGIGTSLNLWEAPRLA